MVDQPTTKMLPATKSYAPGDLITTVKPMIYSLSSEFKGRRCDGCFLEASSSSLASGDARSAKTGSLRRCSRCLRAWYCSTECQHADWPHHKLECRILKQHPTVTFHQQDNFGPFFMRAVLLFRAQPELASQQQTLFNGQMVAFNDLLMHEEFHLKNRTNLLFFKQEQNKLGQFGIKLNYPEDFQLLCRLNTNSYGVQLPSMFDSNGLPTDNSGIETVGHAVSVEYSKFNHSCVPSVFHFYHKIESRFYAAKSIVPGEELTITYKDPCQSTAERRIWLAKYNFECHCQRCLIEDEVGENGIPINHQAIREFRSLLVDQPNNRVEAQWLRRFFSKPLDVINKVYPNFHDRKTDFLINVVKVDAWGRKVQPELVRAAIDNMKVTHRNDHVMKFNDKSKVSEMIKYLADYNCQAAIY